MTPGPNAVEITEMSGHGDVHLFELKIRRRKIYTLKVANSILVGKRPYDFTAVYMIGRDTPEFWGVDLPSRARLLAHAAAERFLLEAK